MTTTESIISKVERFGIGMSVSELASKVYFMMVAEGFDPCIVNDRYLECNGQTYQFIKSRVNGCWKVKEI